MPDVNTYTNKQGELISFDYDNQVLIVRLAEDNSLNAASVMRFSDILRIRSTKNRSTFVFQVLSTIRSSRYEYSVYKNSSEYQDFLEFIESNAIRVLSSKPTLHVI